MPNLLDLYCAEKGIQEPVQMSKTAEEIRLEKISAAADATFGDALNNYLLNFALNDLSR